MNYSSRAFRISHTVFLEATVLIDPTSESSVDDDSRFLLAINHDQPNPRDRGRFW